MQDPRNILIVRLAVRDVDSITASYGRLGSVHVISPVLVVVLDILKLENEPSTVTVSCFTAMISPH